jgi:hypothetical protein
LLLSNWLGILKIAEKIILLFSIATSVYPASPGAMPSTILEASSTANATNSLISLKLFLAIVTLTIAVLFWLMFL